MSGGAFVVRAQSAPVFCCFRTTLQKRRHSCERHRMSKRRRSPNEASLSMRWWIGSANVQLLTSNIARPTLTSYNPDLNRALKELIRVQYQSKTISSGQRRRRKRRRRQSNRRPVDDQHRHRGRRRHRAASRTTRPRRFRTGPHHRQHPTGRRSRSAHRDRLGERGVSCRSSATFTTTATSC